nr:hypothetical protein [Tanacetum cinerariifolium]
MSQATSLLRMKTKEELVPKDDQVGINTSNVRTDDEVVLTNTFHQLAITIPKTHIIYNSITLTVTVPTIYIQQFWHTMSENQITKTYLFQLDNQWLEVGVDLIRIVLKLTPPRQNQQFTTPNNKNLLLQFVKNLRYDDLNNTFKIISQAIVEKHHQPWRTILSILNKFLTGKDSGLDRARHTMIQLL